MLLQPFVAFGVVAVLCIGLGGMVWQVVRAPANRKSAVGAVQESRPVNIATTTRKRRTVSYLILGLTLLCVAIVPVLVAEKVPRHIAFRQTIPRFEQALMQADHSSVSKIGRYPVKTVAQDSEGGIYFKTGDRVTGGWMDPEERITYGFAYQPDPEQSPFGEWDYRLWPIAGAGTNSRRRMRFDAHAQVEPVRSRNRPTARYIVHPSRRHRRNRL